MIEIWGKPSNPTVSKQNNFVKQEDINPIQTTWRRLSKRRRNGTVSNC